MPASPSDRASLRRQLLAAREALTSAQHAALNACVCEHLAGLLAGLPVQEIAFCWPIRAEPDVRTVITTWLAADAARCAGLPVVVDRDAPLQFRRWQPGEPMLPDRHGIPAPADGELLCAELLIIPLNGFDARGYRLGYGGGYFDRTLATLDPLPLTVGVGFELARLERIDNESHDLPLDWVVTEAGAFRADRDEKKGS